MEELVWMKKIGNDPIVLILMLRCTFPFMHLWVFFVGIWEKWSMLLIKSFLRRRQDNKSNCCWISGMKYSDKTVLKLLWGITTKMEVKNLWVCDWLYNEGLLLLCMHGCKYVCTCFSFKWFCPYNGNADTALAKNLKSLMCPLLWSGICF